MIQRVVGMVVAVIAAIFSVPQPVVAAPASPVDVVYAYDGHHSSAQLEDLASERGPPTTHDHAIIFDAFDLGSRGDATHPNGPPPGSTTTYAYPGPLVPEAQATTTTGGDAVLAGEEFSSVQPAQDAADTVAMGRNMGQRVIPYAERKGYGYYKGTPKWVPRKTIARTTSPATLENVDLWFNKRWINGQMRRGNQIVDIGEPPGYSPSRFYDMELDQVRGYWNYFQDIQP